MDFLQKNRSKMVKFGLCGFTSDLQRPIGGPHPMLYFSYAMLGRGKPHFHQFAKSITHQAEVSCATIVTNPSFSPIRHCCQRYDTKRAYKFHQSMIVASLKIHQVEVKQYRGFHAITIITSLVVHQQTPSPSSSPPTSPLLSSYWG